MTFSYLVCATPRSGSTLLCEALKATGRAGRPEEYFEAVPSTGMPREPRDYLAGLDDAGAHRLIEGARPRIPDYSDIRGVPRYEEHLARVREWGTTPNGVFGAKVMWAHLVDLAVLTGHASPVEAAAELFGEPRCLWVRREDRVRQAVSLWRAMQTQSWRSEAAEREPRYSFAAMRHLARALAADDAAWERFFATSALPVLEIGYGELVRDLEGTLDRALDHVGVPHARGDLDCTPPMRRQSDDLSDAWVAAYEREAVETAA
ncbi:MAG TPA: Stf0 family sulfotransferase [Solirubrobacteraceae bacterium]|nr:Stf0 family sulfotransferase [Solirubrobacteraceae bacterium]